MRDDQTGTASASPLTAASARTALRTACVGAGLDRSHAQLIRFGENALFHLPTDGVVVRIARTMDYWADAEKEVNISRWLNGHHFPAAEACDIGQPIAANGHPATFWKFIPGRPGGPADIATLGTLLRRLHHTPPPTDFRLPPEDILGRVGPRIEKATIPNDDKTFLRDQFHELQTKVAELEYPLPPAPTHGDAHSENLMIQDEGGKPVLIDFERSAWGQPEWDLALTATEHITAKWWTAAQYHEFSKAYGYDVTEWSTGFDTLKAVHELKMTTWLMQNVDGSPEIAEEFQLRMRTLRGEPSPGWRPF